MKFLSVKIFLVLISCAITTEGFAAPLSKVCGPLLEELGGKRKLEHQLFEQRYRTDSGRLSDRFFGEHPELFSTLLEPQLASVTSQFSPDTETEIQKLENQIRKYVRKNGFDALPPFALRGMDANDGVRQGPFTDKAREKAVAEAKRNRYIEKEGGNFFVFYPTKGIFAKSNATDEQTFDRSNDLITLEAFFGLTYASSGSTSNYARMSESDSIPLVIVVDLNEKFNLPIEGGNDGIDGRFPYSFGLMGHAFNLSNLDVGNIVRPSVPKKDRLGPAKVLNGIPDGRVQMIIGQDGIPPEISIQKTDSKRMGYLKALAQSRWVYMQVLSSLVNRIENWHLE